jgi:AcrR family transcriptional regulator
MNKSRPRGRPRGRTQTREDILAVARRRFLAEGYDRVTMRSVADEAGVDAALISYHFGSKRGLFGACLQLPANPPDVLRAALPGPPATLPERLIRTVLTTWDDPDRTAALRALAAAAIQDPEVARLFREMAEREIVGVIAERLGGADAQRRAAVAASQVAGLIFLRYVLRIEPLASLPADEVAARMAPAMRAVLAGPRRPPAPVSVTATPGSSGRPGRPATP